MLLIGLRNSSPEAPPRYLVTKYFFEPVPQLPYATDIIVDLLYKRSARVHEVAYADTVAVVPTAKKIHLTSLFQRGMEQEPVRTPPPPLRPLLPAPAGGVRKEAVERHKPTRVNACEACRIRKSKASHPLTHIALLLTLTSAIM